MTVVALSSTLFTVMVRTPSSSFAVTLSLPTGRGSHTVRVKFPAYERSAEIWLAESPATTVESVRMHQQQYFVNERRWDVPRAAASVPSSTACP